MFHGYMGTFSLVATDGFLYPLFFVWRASVSTWLYMSVSQDPDGLVSGLEQFVLLMNALRFFPVWPSSVLALIPDATRDVSLFFLISGRITVGSCKRPLRPATVLAVVHKHTFARIPATYNTPRKGLTDGFVRVRSRERSTEGKGDGA
jgi:hypothetical protein